MKTKKYLAVLVLFASLSNNRSLYAQNVEVTGILSNIAAKEITISRPVKRLFWNYFKEADITIPVKDGRFKIVLTVDGPEMMHFSCTDSITHQELSQPLFLSKGYKMTIRFTLNNKELLVKAQGIGASDNQRFNINSYTDLNFDEFFNAKDSLSAGVFTYISKQYKKDSLLFAAYVTAHHPSPAFKKAWKYNLKYEVLNFFYYYSEGGIKFYIGGAYTRNHDQWIDLINRLFKSTALSDDNALISENYQQLVRNYILRKKERLWMEWRMNKAAFLAEWYGTDMAKAEKEYEEDMENKVCQKIIERSFSDKTKEYAYAILFETALQSSNIKNMQFIYADFVKEFPASGYIAKFQPAFSSMFARAKRPLTDKMIFVKDGDKLNTWDSVLSLVKGKTVLLDMWGTWCGPCREQMESHSHAIKEYFKGKGLDYLYIANKDQGQEQKWKELIAYFNLEGSHILANEKLSKDIMSKIKGTGYPTYAIIHRDGSFELSKAGYPMNREVLIAQIEQALK
jgi:thiol-disulfide isomerase/thioredoxin